MDADPDAVRDPREVVAIPRSAQQLGWVTVEKVAVNAVMAGCKPEYLPVAIRRA